MTALGRTPTLRSAANAVGTTNFRGAGFQPASGSEPRLRRPKHYDLGRIPYFVTTRTHRSERLFVGSAARIAIDELFDLRSKYGFLVASFVFMPDHAHLIVVPAMRFTISQTMHVIKRWRINTDQNREGSVWQDGFRDNAPRSIDEFNAYVAYIEHNPVRAGLVHDAVAYPFSSADGRCEADYHAFFAIERDDAG